jgi:hypothetical protein
MFLVTNKGFALYARHHGSTEITLRNIADLALQHWTIRDRFAKRPCMGADIERYGKVPIDEAEPIT